MNLTVADMSLVVLIGPSGSGKSTFARRHFAPTEILSSDFCRGLVSADENDQAATGDAFDVLHYIARKRLARGLVTVIDATNVRPEDRKPLIQLAREYHVMPVAIVLDMPAKLCAQRNELRPDRQFGSHVIRQQCSALRRGIRSLDREGFRYIYVLRSVEDIDTAVIERTRLWTDRRDEHEPFDIVGDIHGCFDELRELMRLLGYEIGRAASGDWSVTPPSTSRTPRKVVFLGDLVDRGPNSPDVLRLVMGMVAAGTALCVPGNHDVKLLRKLRGKNVQITHGLAQTIEQLASQPPEFALQVEQFIDKLTGHYVLDDGRLVVAHAGMKESMQGRASGASREFALYGETTGETDDFGLPVRYNWAAEYRGRAKVVYGHTPVPTPEWLNQTINIDTGCVFGGKLSALRYPENEIISVAARQAYSQPVRPFVPPEHLSPVLSLQQQHDDVLDLSDVIGKRIISTPLLPNITIREENVAAALEVMSRFAVDPRWLIYLPPTMSPCETSHRENLLEHPDDAFDYYLSRGVERVVCQLKHMGSRAIVVVCRDGDCARRRFGVAGDVPGICYTRTGRRFFDDEALEAALLEIVQSAAAAAGLWDELRTDWLCLDCELMPWSAKAQALIRDQYAAVGSAARAALHGASDALARASSQIPQVQSLLSNMRARQRDIDRYVSAYRGYCWPVRGISDIKLAPFHLLASEREVHDNKDHLWHMDLARRLVEASECSLAQTEHRIVALTDPGSQAEAVEWWQDLTARGDEGMVVKPLQFIAKGARGILQPALKCRGSEYLRIIYGPHYIEPQNLQRLRSRSLGRKRSLAIREFSLGLEALHRFVRHEPLRRVHECVFAVLALESEPVDPRL